MSYNPAVAVAVDGILSGTVQAGAGAMQVSSASLVVVRNGKQEVVPNTTLNVSAAPGAGNVRVDMVQWDGTTLTIKDGTAAAISAVSCPTPDVGNIPIALIFIYALGTTVRDLGYQDATGQFNAIFAYYYSRRGLYAALLSRQDSSVASGGVVDPVVALPVYNARAALYDVKFNGSLQQADGNLTLGIEVIFRLDGTSITRTDSTQRIGTSPNSISQGRAGIGVQYSRAQVAAGAHRWNPFLTVSTNPSTLDYRQMELSEIL